MKATDLMIGDWVRMPFGLPEIRQIKYPSEIDDADFYEPIPLTDEILRESGFAQHHSYEEGITFEKFVTDGMRIDQLAKDLFVWICPGTDMGILTFHNVHELQHALRLCGIDKEIVL